MKRLIIVVVLLGLAGCATGYQSKGMTGGYSETRLQENMYRVNYRGNGHTDMDEAQDYALLRAAELAIEHGYKYIEVAQEDSRFKTSYNKVPNQYGGGGSTVNRPMVSYTVRFGNEPKENTLDAAELTASLKTKYGIDK